jgi:hypothetical protein
MSNQSVRNLDGFEIPQNDITGLMELTRVEGHAVYFFVDEGVFVVPSLSHKMYDTLREAVVTADRLLALRSKFLQQESHRTASCILFLPDMHGTVEPLSGFVLDARRCPVDAVNYDCDTARVTYELNGASVTELFPLDSVYWYNEAQARSARNFNRLVGKVASVRRNMYAEAGDTLKPVDSWTATMKKVDVILDLAMRIKTEEMRPMTYRENE